MTKMAEVNVVKQPKHERPELSRWLGFDAPLFRGSLFSVNPLVLMRQFTDDIDRMFAHVPKAMGNGAEWTPAIEVKQKEGKFQVTAELPA
jgi:HSP20 family molecular chaperone IbpA